MNALDLPLKKQYYLMIESGIKPDEYRGITPYWCNRLLGSCPLGIKNYWEPVLERIFEDISEYGERMPNSYNLQNLLVGQYGVRDYTHVRFRYGYTRRTMLFEIDHISIGLGNPDWGAPDGMMVFILKIGKRVQQP